VFQCLQASKKKINVKSRELGLIQITILHYIFTEPSHRIHSEIEIHLRS